MSIVFMTFFVDIFILVCYCRHGGNYLENTVPKYAGLRYLD